MNGMGSSVCAHMDLMAQAGIMLVDLLPYDDKLAHSLLLSYDRRSAHVPNDCLITIAWGNKGVQGPDQTEKVADRRIERPYCQVRAGLCGKSH